MKAVSDPDLCFLQKSNHRDLKLLADLLVYDDDGKERNNERLTKESDYNNNKESLPNALGAIVDEFLRYGGNTIANVVRRHGTNYKQILFDICERLLIDFDKRMTAVRLERKIVQRTIELIAIDAKEQEMKDLCQEFGIEFSENNEQNIESIIENAMPHRNLVENTMPYLINCIDNRQDFPKWYEKIRKKVIRVNVGEGAWKATNPVGWAIRTADPNYQVTYPGVLLISYMRNKQLNY
jgi:uncharacterized protein YaaW (UPF0174 family)